MIGSILHLVAHHLNLALCNHLRIDPASRKVFLSPGVSPDGDFSGVEDNALVLALVSIARDPIASPSLSRFPAPPPPQPLNPLAPIPSTPLPIPIHLQVLLAARFKPDQAIVGLDLLAHAIAFFHAHPRWDPLRFPGFPDGVRDLSFDLEPLDLPTLNNVWSSLGTKLLPAALYRIRMISIPFSEPPRPVPALTSPASNVAT